MTFFGQTGCGIGASLVTFTLTRRVPALPPKPGHNNGCPDGTSTGTFTVADLQSLTQRNGWACPAGQLRMGTFNIQVRRSLDLQRYRRLFR